MGKKPVEGVFYLQAASGAFQTPAFVPEKHYFKAACLPRTSSFPVPNQHSLVCALFKCCLSARMTSALKSMMKLGQLVLGKNISFTLVFGSGSCYFAAWSMKSAIGCCCHTLQYKIMRDQYICAASLPVWHYLCVPGYMRASRIHLWWSHLFFVAATRLWKGRVPQAIALPDVRSITRSWIWLAITTCRLSLSTYITMLPDCFTSRGRRLY